MITHFRSQIEKGKLPLDKDSKKDLERHRVVDLLPDRLAETLAVWLREHPGIEVISRDRAGDFAKGGRSGAPAALQIADRWHVIQNLAQALDPAVRRLGRSLGFSKNTKQKKAPERKSSTPLIRLTPAQQQRRENLHERFEQVQGLYQQGRSLGEIARIVEIDKNTLRSFVQSQPWAGTDATGRRKPTESNLAPYLPYLHQRWKAGCQNIAVKRDYHDILTEESVCQEGAEHAGDQLDLLSFSGSEPDHTGFP